MKRLRRGWENHWFGSHCQGLLLSVPAGLVDPSLGLQLTAKQRSCHDRDPQHCSLPGPTAFPKVRLSLCRVGPVPREPGKAG